MDKAKRKAIIAGNWKMNKTATEAAKLVDELIPAVKDAPTSMWAQRTFTLRSPARSPARSARTCCWIWAWSTSSWATLSAASTLQRRTRPLTSARWLL